MSLANSIEKWDKDLFSGLMVSQQVFSVYNFYDMKIIICPDFILIDTFSMVSLVIKFHLSKVKYLIILAKIT